MKERNVSLFAHQTPSRIWKGWLQNPGASLKYQQVPPQGTSPALKRTSPKAQEGDSEEAATDYFKEPSEQSKSNPTYEDLRSVGLSFPL